jgi:hypothetical protein
MRAISQHLPPEGARAGAGASSAPIEPTLAADTAGMAKNPEPPKQIDWKRIPADFVIPAQPVLVLARKLHHIKMGILLNEHVAEDGPTVSPTLAGLALKASFRRRSTAPIDLVRALHGSKSVIPPALPYERSEIWNLRAPGSARRR